MHADLLHKTSGNTADAGEIVSSDQSLAAAALVPDEQSMLVRVFAVIDRIFSSMERRRKVSPSFREELQFVAENSALRAIGSMVTHPTPDHFAGVLCRRAFKDFQRLNQYKTWCATGDDECVSDSLNIWSVPEDNSTTNDVIDILAQALPTLTDDQREIFHMRYELGMRNMDVARARNQNPAYCSAIYRRTLRKLREFFEKHGYS